MKLLITILLFFVMGLDFSNANSLFDNKTSEELDQYEILVKDKTTGKVVGKMTRKEFKVVKISKQPNLVVTKCESKNVIQNTTKPKKNSVIVHVGKGRDGLKVDSTGGYREVSERDRTVGGATYCRNVDNGEAGLCASGFTNSTLTLGVKIDF